MAEENNNKSWWSTLPGIITSTATLVTAIGGLIAILNANGYFKSTDETKNSTLKTEKDSVTAKQTENTITPVAANQTTQHEKIESTNNTEATTAYILKGNVGRLAAVFRLTFNNQNHLINGTYYYPKRPGIIYNITGTIGNNTISLNEYTSGVLSATCTLKTTDQLCYTGVMNNKNGRVIDINICKINQ